MNPNTKEEKNESAPPKNDVAAQLQKIQQHLVYLERKIDTLIQNSASGQGQGQGRGQGSFQRDRFSKPRRFDRDRSRGFSQDRPPRGEHSSPPRDREPSSQDRPREDNQGTGGFFRKKKRYNRPRP